MNFYSLNDKNHTVKLEEALFRGLAPDGGLYYPESIPAFSLAEIKALKANNLNEVAFKVMQKWFGEEIVDEELRALVETAQAFPIIIENIAKYEILELFHGPTLAFKDVAAAYLAQVMQYFLNKNNKKIKLLVATSGDTGGAIAHGFAGLDNVDVYLLFPKGKVSRLQEEQLTRVADNVMPIIVNGVFDDCQDMVKQAFVDPDLKRLNLTSANSISIGRLIPQTIYYFYAFAQLQTDKLEFVVPSGNFGNLTGGLLAWKMGLPVNKFIAATNANDAVVKYYQTGKYRPQLSETTLSNAMDVGAPSNFSRIIELFGNDHKQFKKMVEAVHVSDAETIEAITIVHKQYKYLLDPHTAVAWVAAEKLADSKNKTVIVSTASPIKFAEEINAATGIAIDNSKALTKIKSTSKKGINIPADYQGLKSILLD